MACVGRAIGAKIPWAAARDRSVSFCPSTNALSALNMSNDAKT
jgi:hypothetical protein